MGNSTILSKLTSVEMYILTVSNELSSFASMKSSDITRICSLHLHTRPKFGGCVGADGLPLKIAFYPVFFICNSENWSEEGFHWLLIMIKSDKDKPQFFDSVGKSPGHYSKDIEDFLIANSKGGYIVNDVRVQQHNTNSCASYCLTVADFFCQGYTLEQIMPLFDKENLTKNEILVNTYVNSHMKRV